MHSRLRAEVANHDGKTAFQTLTLLDFTMCDMVENDSMEKLKKQFS